MENRSSSQNGVSLNERTSSASSIDRSSRSKPQNSEQSIQQIEKSVTSLLIATKQLLETLTLWSRGNATEAKVSDVYVRLGYEFNIASRAFQAIGFETRDLGPVPDLLRNILEETLSNEPTQENLDKYLPRIRDIIVNLLQGLKKKQQKLRASRSLPGADRQGSTRSTRSYDSDDSVSTPSNLVPSAGEFTAPPRTSSATPGRESPTRQNTGSDSITRQASASIRDVQGYSSTTPDALPTIQGPFSPSTASAPYPEVDIIPGQYEPQRPSKPNDLLSPRGTHKQRDALAALQNGGELERRASRRFSAYQVSKYLGTSSAGIPMLPPAQTSPIPNRGQDVRESMKAMRSRGSRLGSRERPKQLPEQSPNRYKSRSERERTTEKSNLAQPPEYPPSESPTVKTPEDKLGNSYYELSAEPREVFREPPPIQTDVGEPVRSISLTDPAPTKLKREHAVTVPARRSSSKRDPVGETPTDTAQSSRPNSNKELVLFLQYKSKVKKLVLNEDEELSISRLRLAFIEKFAWNTSDGAELPEIYIQDAETGIRYELEDMKDVRNGAILTLNVDAMEEVKKHVDEGMGGLRSVLEDIRSGITGQQPLLQRISDKQQDQSKEMSRIATAPPSSAPRRWGTDRKLNNERRPDFGRSQLKGATSPPGQMEEIQNMRRDLAVMRQNYTNLCTDLESTIAAVRLKASKANTAAKDAPDPIVGGETGRGHVNTGIKYLKETSENLLNRVDDISDVVEDLRKDVVTRGVRPLPRQLDTVSKEISLATSEFKKLQEYIRREKPGWVKIWTTELETVADDQDVLRTQEALCEDLTADFESLSNTFGLIEEATKQQNLANPQGTGASTGTSSRSASATIQNNSAVDPAAAKDGVLGEVRALQPNHESRLEAIERSEKARVKELESRRGAEVFKKELGSFVDEGRLKKTGGTEEAERLRRQKDDRIRREVWERMNARAAGQEVASERAAAPVPADADEENIPGGLDVPAFKSGEAARASASSPPAGGMFLPSINGDGGDFGMPMLASALQESEATTPDEAFVEARELLSG